MRRRHKGKCHRWSNPWSRHSLGRTSYADVDQAKSCHVVVDHVQVVCLDCLPLCPDCLGCQAPDWPPLALPAWRATVAHSAHDCWHSDVPALAPALALVPARRPFDNPAVARVDALATCQPPRSPPHPQRAHDTRSWFQCAPLWCSCCSPWPPPRKVPWSRWTRTTRIWRRRSS